MSPIDGISLPFLSTTVLIFRGYVVGACDKTVVHVNCLQSNNSKNANSRAIVTTLFDDGNINFKSYLKRRVQFYSNSCGVWPVACIASYVHALPLSSGLDDAFDIASSLLEQRAEIPVNSSVPTSSNWKSEDHFEILRLHVC